MADVVRLSYKVLSLLSRNGRPCEACNYDVHDHSWIDMDEEGFAVHCNIKQMKDERREALEETND